MWNKHAVNTFTVFMWIHFKIDLLHTNKTTAANTITTDYCQLLCLDSETKHWV
jgi:hypothetical protein